MLGVISTPGVPRGAGWALGWGLLWDGASLPKIPPSSTSPPSCLPFCSFCLELWC